MPIYDFEYNGKIYSFEGDTQPNEQEVMDFINNYKEPTPAPQPKQEETKPIMVDNENPQVITGGISKEEFKNTINNMPLDILSGKKKGTDWSALNNQVLADKGLSLEDKKALFKQIKDTRDMSAEWQEDGQRSVNNSAAIIKGLGAGLGGEGIIPLAAGAGLFGLGDGILERKKPLDTIKEIGLMTAGGQILSKTPQAINLLSKTPVGKAIANNVKPLINKAVNSKAGQKIIDLLGKEIQIGNKNIQNPVKAEKTAKTLDTLNPNENGIFEQYNPQNRANLPLGKNITTYDKTANINPDTIIEVYRGVPNNVSEKLNPGDFITTNKQLAQDYAGNGKVISQKVKASDILDDITEPLGEEYIYRPSILNKGFKTPETTTKIKTSEPEIKTSQLGQSDFVNDTFGYNINKDYEVLSNEELINAANEEVTKNSNSVQTDLLTKGADEKAEFSALDFEKGRQLISQLYAEGRADEAAKLTEVLTRKGTQAGQAVQAMSLWGRTTPEGAEMLAQRVINKYNDAHPKKPITLTPEKRQQIRQLAEEVQKLPDGYDKEFATATMLKEISDVVPKSASDKFRTLRNISLLLNPKTFNRNITGNTILGGAENILTKPLASGIDKITSLATGQRSRVTTQGAEYLKGLLEGAKRGNKEVLAGVNTRNVGSRFDLPNTRTFKAPVLKQLEIATDWSLRVPDNAFYQASFEESLVNQIRTEMINKGVKVKKLTPELIEKYTTPKIVKQATQEALEAVYQNNGAFSNFLSGLRKNLRFGQDFGVGDVLLPYAQTPANVAEMGLNYSPLGLVKGGVNLAKGNQRQGTLDLARGLIGTGLGGLGYGLAKSGVITPNSENTREKLNKELLGERPNTIKIGDNYYSYNQLQPLASPLSAGASMGNSATPLEAIDSYLGTILDTSMMRGANQLIEDTERFGPTTAIANGILGLPSQLIPTGLNQVNAYIDPIQRETYDPNPLKRTLNYMGAKIPGVSKTLPARYNLKGEEKQKYESQGIEKAWDVFANPIFKTKAKDDVVARELIELQKSTGENVLLPLASKKISKADNLKLSGKQYSEYQKVLGEKTYEALEDLINSPEYINANDMKRATLAEQRQKIVKAFVDEALFETENQYKPKGKDPVKKIENKVKKFDSKINKLKTIKLMYNDLEIQDIESILEE